MSNALAIQIQIELLPNNRLQIAAPRAACALSEAQLAARAKTKGQKVVQRRQLDQAVRSRQVLFPH